MPGTTSGGQEYEQYEDGSDEDRYIDCPRGHMDYRAGDAIVLVNQDLGW